MKYRFKTKPAPYQLDALKRAIRAKRFGVFFEQRVGKTKVALDYAGYYNTQGLLRKVLIVCPLNARFNWLEEMQKHLPVPYEAEFLPGSKRDEFLKKRQNPEKLLFVVVTWGILRTEWEALQKWKPDLIIADEIHRARHHTSKQSKALQKLSREATHFLGLTGTPVAHSPLNVFGEFLCIDPTVFGTRWAAFESRYAVKGGYMGYETIGYRNLDELSDKMARVSIRVRRRDVLDEPDVEHVRLPVPLEPSARKLYDDFRRESIVAFEGMTSAMTAEYPTTKFLRLRQLTGGWAKDDTGEQRQVSTAKLDALKEFLQDHVVDGGEKVVIVAYFKLDVQSIAKLAQDMCLNPLVITGTTGETDRTTFRKAFAEEDSRRVIILQEGTSSEAVSFAAARTMLFYSLDMTLDKYLQIRDRIMGREQKADSVSYYYLVAHKTVDERIVDGLIKGENLAASIQDKWKWLLSVEP